MKTSLAHSLLERGGNPAIGARLTHPLQLFNLRSGKIMIAVDMANDLAYALVYANIRRQ